MREEIQMHNALLVIQHFQNQVPLAQHLKNFYREHKNVGSKDRKILSALVYGYYRKKGKLVMDDEQMITIASEGEPLLENFYAYWKNKLTITDTWGRPDFQEYFPLPEQVSDRIDKTSFFESHFNQTKVFIRCKTNKTAAVIAELKSAGYLFKSDGNTISFDQPYPLDQTEAFKNGLFEIQDIASQQVSELIRPQKNEAWWDCCAGAGGKSLMLLDTQPQMQLFVSDIRESILNNLKERFFRSGIQNFNSFAGDITNPDFIKRLPQFDAIVADVPCSGSGTWGRTPEWLSFFKKEQLENYIAQQRKIISSVIQKLKPGGKLIYITCSIYTDENENNVKWFADHLSLQLELEKYFQFSKDGGDTLYGAALSKK